MLALTRYQLALLARSQRWLPPTLLFGVLVVAGSSGGQRLGDSLGYCGAALVISVGWLTRSALTMEPGAARGCVVAAGGARRAHLAVLVAATLGGLVLAVAGAGYAVWVSQAPGGRGAFVAALATGLAADVVCVLVGSAVGALCNPPLVRRTGYSILTMGIVLVAALVASVSPANAAIRGTIERDPGHAPALWPFLAALALATAAWAISVAVAAHRAGDPAASSDSGA